MRGTAMKGNRAKAWAGPATIACVPFLFAPILLGTLGGCALMRGKPLEPWPLPKVADGPIRGNWVQTVRLERGGKELPLLAVIDCDGTTLTLAGMTPTQQRLTTITWRDGGVAQENEPGLPIKVDGEGILRDLVLAYWPSASLQAALAGTGWSASITDSVRILSGGGKRRIEIEPEKNSEGDEGKRIRHLREGYTVHVVTVERSGP